jgi:uncharacterized BrkB/YihY/UPF0761 family membrane protein
MDTSSLLAILVRWVHISSAVILIGGACYAAFLGRQGKLKGAPWTVGQVLPFVIAILLAGIFQLMTRMQGAPPAYHAIFGVKFLLVMHVAAVLLISAKPEVTDDKRARLLTGAAFSGLVILLLSSTLRSI